MQDRREEEPGAYWVVREEFRRPSTQQMDFFSSLPAYEGGDSICPATRATTHGDSFNQRVS